MPSDPIRSVLVTGASGNLGRKLVEHLLRQPWCERIVALDREAADSAPARVEAIAADLRDAADRRWRDALATVDAAVHLAAQNPSPLAPYDDACLSFDMTANLAGAARAAGVKRLVFASSNHVMGGYKDPPLADGLAPGTLTTDRLPAPGTRWQIGDGGVTGTAYGVAKLMGERVCTAAAALSEGALTAVSVRIGWCQPGENRPRTIVAGGTSRPSGPLAGYRPSERDLVWFRNMWLSNPDFLAVAEAAIVAPAAAWPAPGIVVNGMSANAGMAWDLAFTRRALGYESRSDVWAELD